MARLLRRDALVSLATAPKPDDGARRASSRAHAADRRAQTPLWHRPGFWAGMAFVAVVGLNV